MSPSLTEHVREANRHAVYRALLASDRPTRADLVTSTGLSAPTVATILSEFQTLGVVIEAGTEAATGGRPAQRVRLRADALHVLAVDLSGRRAHACRIDLNGAVRERHAGPHLVPGATDELISWLEPLLRDRPRPHIKRLALAVPGVVDSRSGRVDLAPALGWSNTPVAALFERALGVQTLLENDVNALALAELHYGVGADHRHVLYVAIGSGLGAGVVIDGSLYRGAHAAAGEIGSSLALERGSGAAPSRALPGPLEKRVVALADRCLDHHGEFCLESDEAQLAFESLGALLSSALHDLTCLLDPELLVVSWPPDRDGRLVARLREGWLGHWELPIRAGSLGRDGAARGVARLALEDVEDELCRAHPRHQVAPRVGRQAQPEAAPSVEATESRSHHV